MISLKKFFKNKIFQLFLWWSFLPLIFLLFLFFKFGFFTSSLISFLQIIFVFFELFFLLLFIKKIANLKGINIFAFLFSFLFIVINCYYLFDFLFFLQTDVRMDYELLAFLLEAKSFISSVSINLLYIFISGCFIVLILSLLFFMFIKNNIKKLILSKKLILIFLLVLFLLILNSVFLKNNDTYFFDNLIFRNQIRFLKLEKINENDEGDFLNIFSKKEKFKRLDSKKPLLKYTYGFEGEKEFDIDVKNKKPHIIFLFLESFRAKDIGVLGGKHGATPNFDNLSKEGVLFTNFYANGVQTTRAVIASLFGILPRFSARAVQTESEDINLIGLPEILKENGYYLSFLHNGSLEFQKKKDFFTAHNYDDILGWQDIAKKENDFEDNSWGIHDEYLMKYSVSYLKEKDNNQDLPVFLTMFTVSNHHPWKKPQNFEAIEIETKDEEYSKFLQTMNYTDYSLGLFIESLKKNNLYDKSIIFIMADTSAPQGEHDNFMLIKNAYEENFKIPLLILAPNKLKKPLIINTVASQVDILPTVMDILNIQGKNCSIGSSLMRKVDERLAISNNPFTNGYWALRFNKDKFIYDVANKKGFLYNIEKDPKEENNIIKNNKEKDFIYSNTVFMVYNLFLKSYKENLFK